MGHAICALFVATGAIAVPVRRLHKLLERCCVTLAEEIAGLLPTEHVARGHAPGRAMILLITRQEVQIQWRVREPPPAALAPGEQGAEEFLRLWPDEEMLLVRRPLVSVTRGNRHANAQFRGPVEESGDIVGSMAVENRGIDVDLKTGRFRGFDRRDRDVVYSRLRHRLVVVFLQAVEMNAEEQVARRFEQMQLLLQQKGVRA